MKRINTNFVVDPSIQQPFTTKSLDFLQDGNKEMIQALCRNIITTKGYSYNSTIPYYISSFSAPFTSDGAVFFNNELYILEENYSSLNYAIIDNTPDGVADPLTFTDLYPRNVHNNRRLSYTNVSGGSLFAMASVINVSTPPVVVVPPKPVSAYNVYGNSGVQFGALTGFSQTLKCTSEIYDDDNLYNTSTGVYTVPKNGYYKVTGHLTFRIDETLTDGDVEFLVYKNGSYFTSFDFEYLYGGNYEKLLIEGDVIVKANAGDTLELYSIGSWSAPSTAYVRTSNVKVMIEYMHQ